MVLSETKWSNDDGSLQEPSWLFSRNPRGDLGDWVLRQRSRVRKPTAHRTQGTYVSTNHFLAERQLSAADVTNPELKKEKTSLTFQDGIDVGPPHLDQLNMALPKWVDMFNSFKKSRTYGGDGVDWNEELREKVRRERQREVDEHLNMIFQRGLWKRL